MPNHHNKPHTDSTSQNRTITQKLKDAFREPHPFARNTATLKPHAVPWFSVYAKRQLRTLGVLAPLAMVVFGWPFAGKWLVNWSNQVYSASPERREGSGGEVHESVKSHKLVRRGMLQEGPVRLET